MPPIKYAVRFKRFSNGDTTEIGLYSFDHLLNYLIRLNQDDDVDKETIEIG